MQKCSPRSRPGPGGRQSRPSVPRRTDVRVLAWRWATIDLLRPSHGVVGLCVRARERNSSANRTATMIILRGPKPAWQRTQMEPSSSAHYRLRRYTEEGADGVDSLRRFAYSDLPETMEITSTSAPFVRSASAQDAIEEGDIETLREDILEASRGSSRGNRAPPRQRDFFEFLTDLLDEWSARRTLPSYWSSIGLAARATVQ